MKKKLALILSLVMMVAMLGACGQTTANKTKDEEKKPEVKELTAEEIMENCLEKFEDIDSMDLTMDMDMDMDVSGQQMKQEMSYDIVVNNASNSDLEMALEIDMDILGQQSSQTVYYKDGMYYMDMAGEKYKMAMDVQEALDNLGGANSFASMKIDDFEELEKVETDEGYQVKFVMNASALSDMANTVLGNTAAGMDISVEGIEGEYYLNDDFEVEKIIMDMKMSATVEGMEFVVDAALELKYNSFGEYIEIEFPDFSEYEEIAL